MNDYLVYPALMWMLTTSLLAVTLVAALVPLAAACVPARKGR